MYHTYGLSNFFVSYASNLRLFCVMVIGIGGWVVFIQVARHLKLPATAYSSYIVALGVVWIFALEVFTVPLLKITLRRLGKASRFDKVDLCNDAAVNILRDIEDLDHIIESESLCAAFRAYAETLYCEENVDILTAIHKLRKMPDITSQRNAAADIMKNYVFTDAPYQVNICDDTQCELVRQHQKLQSDPQAHVDANMFAEVEDELKILLRLNILDGFREREAREKAAHSVGTLLSRDVRVMLHNGGVLPTDMMVTTVDEKDTTPGVIRPCTVGMLALDESVAIDIDHMRQPHGLLDFEVFVGPNSYSGRGRVLVRVDADVRALAAARNSADPSIAANVLHKPSQSVSEASEKTHMHSVGDV